MVLTPPCRWDLSKDLSDLVSRGAHCSLEAGGSLLISAGQGACPVSTHRHVEGQRVPLCFTGLKEDDGSWGCLLLRGAVLSVSV